MRFPSVFSSPRENQLFHLSSCIINIILQTLEKNSLCVHLKVRIIRSHFTLRLCFPLQKILWPAIRAIHLWTHRCSHTVLFKCIENVLKLQECQSTLKIHSHCKNRILLTVINVKCWSTLGTKMACWPSLAVRKLFLNQFYPIKLKGNRHWKTFKFAFVQGTVP